MVAPVFISTNSVGGFPFLYTLSSIYCLVDSLIGEGNSTPLQYSCLENLMDGGAWWAACSPWGLEKSDTTERLHFHFSLSCIGEGNGNPLQCSCLGNPRDEGACWAAVYRVAQSRTWLKRLSSSSSMHIFFKTKNWRNKDLLAQILCTLILPPLFRGICTFVGSHWEPSVLLQS